MNDNKLFLADVKAFRDKTVDQMTRVAKQSIQDVASLAQTPVAQGGNMPVDLGFLRNSLTSGINGSSAGMGADSFVLAVAGMELGDTINIAWTAEYAIVRHYKPPSFGQGGGMWRDKAAQQWQQIVAKNARAVQ